MLGTIKGLLFRTYYKFNGMLCRLKGIQIGKNCIITGRTRFFKRKGSNIVLHDNVTLHSLYRCNTLIQHPVSISAILPGATVELHPYCGISGSKIVCCNKVQIGEYTIVGPDCIIDDCKHHSYSKEIGWISNGELKGAPIIIGKRCYIGMRCIILKGVTIGDDCVISAGTVITKDVPAGHLAQGNPAVYTPLPDHLVASHTEKA